MNFTQEFISIPSVIERHNQAIKQLTGPLHKRIQLYESGAGYLVGDLALTQGLAPYRNINSSPATLDYQLLAKAGLLIAAEAETKELVLTVGFPSAVYELYKQHAEIFFTQRDIIIDFQADTINSLDHSHVQLTIDRLEVTAEIQGCIHSVRKGPRAEEDDFFVVSLGYGTCETALSTKTGAIERTCLSVPGLRFAVNNLYRELNSTYYLGMKNEHMINQGFQRGDIVIERKRKDLIEMRRNHLTEYYNEIISPTLKKAFTDGDFERATKLYLVGGGALYQHLVELFQQEFEGVLDVIVPENAENAAAMGYYYRSLQWCGPNHAQKAVGLDVGNAYTVVALSKVKTAAQPNFESHGAVGAMEKRYN